MRSTITAWLGLAAAVAVSLGATPALAKKHKHHDKDKEETTAASPSPETPPAGAAVVAAPAASPASAEVSATVVVTPPAAPATPAVVVEPPAPPPAPPPVIVAPAAPPVRDGVRFRGGVALAGGGEFVSGFAAGLGGIDGRLGVQINHLIGVYVQPHASFGTGTIGQVSGPTGSAAVTANIDFTLFHRFFVGAGGGFGVVNNPYGPIGMFRVGGYPLMQRSAVGPRRKGLMLGLDTRAYFTQVGAVLQMMGAVGYEAF